MSLKPNRTPPRTFQMAVEGAVTSMVDEGLIAPKEDKKWYVSLGDGTWTILDNLPYVFEATAEQIEAIEQDESLVKNDCQKQQESGAYEAHIHIQDLVELSHWDDHTPVTERSTPDRINS